MEKVKRFTSLTRYFESYKILTEELPCQQAVKLAN